MAAADDETDVITSRQLIDAARAQPGLCADAGLPSEMRALGSVVDDLFEDADELAFDEFCERMGGLSGAAL